MSQRYNTRPSQILGYHPLDGRGFMLDLFIIKNMGEFVSEYKTLKSDIQRKRLKWDPEARKELGIGRWQAAM